MILNLLLIAIIAGLGYLVWRGQTRTTIQAAAIERLKDTTESVLGPGTNTGLLPTGLLNNLKSIAAPKLNSALTGISITPKVTTGASFDVGGGLFGGIR